MFTLEIIRNPRPAKPPKAAILDFDGTISLIREGWQNVMIPLFVEVLDATPHAETPAEIERCVRDFVDLLTGKQTIYQCIQLAAEVRKRGGTPLEPQAYKEEYHRRLSDRIRGRLETLRDGGDPLEHVVPGAFNLLEMLRRRGIVVYLASGTDEVFVREEAELLGVTSLCDGGIYGAQADYKTFSKAMVIQRIIRDHSLGGDELIGFGDGYVEIENVHDVGGFAVGVASNEAERVGVDTWKRNRLIAAGADWIIPDYSDIAKLEQCLFGHRSALRTPHFARFDRSRLRLRPLAERQHDITQAVMLDPDARATFSHPSIDILADRIREAKTKRATVLWMMGAHVIRTGNGPHLIRLMKERYVTHFAMNGAGAIHDFELAMIGATTESVARYISEGQFGLWTECGKINDAVNAGVRDGLGFGEAVGRMIDEENFPFKENSLLWNAYKMRVPVTIHVGIGCDIIHEHPNFDGAATGEASYTDFLIYTQAITNLEGGVFCNFGSGVIGPEVYLKALAMSRNVAHREGRRIANFTTAVFDLLPLEGQDIHEAPPKTDPRYYFRPWKTILARTAADGGESYYIAGEHNRTIPALAGRVMKNGE